MQVSLINKVVRAEGETQSIITEGNTPIVVINADEQEYDTKIKIAVDIDDTILSTKELEDYYWGIFLENHPEIDDTKEYHWGDSELALFWKEHREDMAYGKVKEGVAEAFNKMLGDNKIVDLLFSIFCKVF